MCSAGARLAARGGQNAVKPHTLIPRPHLSTKPGQVQRVVDIDLGDGTAKRSVTRGTQRAAAVLRALGITDLDPPIPPQPGQTIV